METPSHTRYDSLYAIFFAGLFIPKSYFHLPAQPEISISVLVNPLLMIGLIVVLMVDTITELVHQGVKLTDFWTVLPSWQKFCAAIVAVFILIWLISLEFHSTSKTPQSSVAQRLMSQGTVAEYYQEYMDAVGYYEQWVTLDSSNPEPRLSLARALMELKSYWLAYEQYKMTIWLSNPDAFTYMQAEAGLQAAMEHIICYEEGIHELEWAKLLRKEYKQQFPDFPLQEQLECQKTLYDPKSLR